MILSSDEIQERKRAELNKGLFIGQQWFSSLIVRKDHLEAC